MKRIGTGEDSLGLNICLADFRDTLGDISANNPSTLSFFSLSLSLFFVLPRRRHFVGGGVCTISRRCAFSRANIWTILPL